jgi:uncharacterized protein
MIFTELRGGDMIEVQQISDEEATSRGLRNWPIWEKEISSFEWTYDEDEECYFLEGEVVVRIGDKEYQLKKGDFVRFKKGLTCHWTVKQPVRKHLKYPSL